jgi:two-component system cell cycle sensor histidine kinase PleC
MSKEENATDLNDFAQCIIDTTREPLIVRDHKLSVVSASRAFYDFFKVTPEETIGEFVYALGKGQWDIPALREVLGEG